MPNLLTKLILLPSILECLEGHHFVKKRVYFLPDRIVGGVCHAHNAVPLDELEQRHVHPVREPDDLVRHDQVADDHGVFADAARHLARHLPDAHAALVELALRARVGKPVVHLAQFGLAGFVWHP